MSRFMTELDEFQKTFMLPLTSHLFQPDKSSSNLINPSLEKKTETSILVGSSVVGFIWKDFMIDANTYSEQNYIRMKHNSTMSRLDPEEEEALASASLKDIMALADILNTNPQVKLHKRQLVLLFPMPRTS